MRERPSGPIQPESSTENQWGFHKSHPLHQHRSQHVFSFPEKTLLDSHAYWWGARIPVLPGFQGFIKQQISHRREVKEHWDEWISNSDHHILITRTQLPELLIQRRWWGLTPDLLGSLRNTRPISPHPLWKSSLSQSRINHPRKTTPRGRVASKLTSSPKRAPCCRTASGRKGEGRSAWHQNLCSLTRQSLFFTQGKFVAGWVMLLDSGILHAKGLWSHEPPCESLPPWYLWQGHQEPGEGFCSHVTGQSKASGCA